MTTSHPTSEPPVAVLRWIDQIREAGERRQALHIVGGNTRAFYGERRQGAALHATEVSGIVDYQPSELVVSARGGTPLAELEAILHEQQQYLAFEPPRFGAAGTVGGAVASGLSGPGRMAGGALREAVLGVLLLNGRGQLQRFGGQVIKNVAGYDVSRLLAGSMGRLGVIVEVSLRVAPIPAASTTLAFELSQAQAIEQTNRWISQARPVHASCWHEGRLVLRLQGAAAAVARSVRELGGEALASAEATAFWNNLRDHQYGVLAGPADLPLWRLAVPPAHPPLALAGEPLVEWHGGQRWWRTDLPAEVVRAAAADAGGHATRFRAAQPADNTLNQGQAPIFTPLLQPMAGIEAALYSAFDPQGIFAPERDHPAP